jgi:hypothetical protein
MIQKDHRKSRHVTDPPSDVKVVCAWCDHVLREGSGITNHVICAKCFEREAQPYLEKQHRAKQEKIFSSPPPEEFRGPFCYIVGQLIAGFIMLLIIFVVVMGAEVLHWLTGGKVPELIELHPKGIPVPNSPPSPADLVNPWELTQKIILTCFLQ